jgi:hypothetical protein
MLLLVASSNESVTGTDVFFYALQCLQRKTKKIFIFAVTVVASESVSLPLAICFFYKLKERFHSGCFFLGHYSMWRNVISSIKIKIYYYFFNEII